MAAKGEIIQKAITWDYILSITNNGWDVFRVELGKFPVSKAFSSPLRKDRSPSFTVFNKEGKWWWKDFSTGDAGDALKFVRLRYSLNGKEAIDKICQDLGISQTTKEYKPLQIIEKAPEWNESEVHIGFSDKKWTKEHHKFWEGTEVDEAHCRKYDTYAVKELAVNRRRVKIGEKEVVIAYYASDVDKVKIYFPERAKGHRFKGNVDGRYLWNLHGIEKCDKLIVIKSMKDLLCTTVMFPCVIATQNESAAIFTEDVVDKIYILSKNIWVAYGSDKQGVEQSTLLSEKYNWKWVNPDNKLLPDINDAYSLIKAKGIDAWRECLRKKRIL